MTLYSGAGRAFGQQRLSSLPTLAVDGDHTEDVGLGPGRA